MIQRSVELFSSGFVGQNTVLLVGSLHPRDPRDPAQLLRPGSVLRARLCSPCLLLPHCRTTRSLFFSAEAPAVTLLEDRCRQILRLRFSSLVDRVYVNYFSSGLLCGFRGRDREVTGDPGGFGVCFQQDFLSVSLTVFVSGERLCSG